MQTNELCRMLAVYLLALLLSVSGCGGGGSRGGDSGAPVGAGAAPSGLSYAAPDVVNVDTPIMVLLPSVTGMVDDYSVTPALPPGLELDVQSGQISGSPSALTAVADYTITARNALGTASYIWSLSVAPAVFSLEPSGGTTIGIGQLQNVFAPNTSNSAEPYPSYIDPADISWSSSQPGIASVTTSGKVLGVNPGNATIRADYQGLSAELNVSVVGVYEEHDIAIAGQDSRHYALYKHVESDSTPKPLILALHGGFGSAQNQASTSLLPAFAVQEDAFVAFLEGTGNFGDLNAWNAGACCGSAQSDNVDDVGYVREVLNTIEASENIDATRIFVTGFSNGAMMTYRLACELSDRIRAVAAVGGGSAEFDQAMAQYYRCAPSRPVPVLHIHAANDRNYPLEGGTGDGPGLPEAGAYSIEATLADWRDRNNLVDESLTSSITPTTICARYSTPMVATRPSAPVEYCLLDPPDVYDARNGIVIGGGHSWPGGLRGGLNGDVPNLEFNANTYMWAFFNSLNSQ